jgi:hypothetical protein
MNGELIIGSVTYQDGGDLRCSRCRNMCRAHYAAKFDSESFTRNDVCLECAAGAIVDAEMLKAQDERETRMFREAMAADDLAEPPLLRDEDDAWRCPYCDETGGEPLDLEGRPMSRWYNGEEGDPGCDGFDGCTLCDPRKAALKREAAEIAAFYGNGNGDVGF